MFGLAARMKFQIHQMDVKTAFLNGVLEEEIYMTVPPGFTNPVTKGKHKDYVLRSGKEVPWGWIFARLYQTSYGRLHPLPFKSLDFKMPTPTFFRVKPDFDLDSFEDDDDPDVDMTEYRSIVGKIIYAAFYLSI
ncbi:hypothetical protein JCM33374_g6549 [Metschnikowia sp. JCM 33374]|nr:hypothetical protein JCM33374_g6549 [Metschnikowia sp. JCM 33374]